MPLIAAAMNRSGALILILQIILAVRVIKSYQGLRRRQKRANAIEEKSQASNPAVLRVLRKEYARYRGSNILARNFLYWNSFLPDLTLFRTIIGGYQWQRFSSWFMHGNLNPAIVLDAQRGLVAAFSDLRARPGCRFPAIKIFKEKLHLLPSPAKNGDTFAAVSLYALGENSGTTGKLRTFFPIVIDCVVQDAVKCEFAKAKIPDAQWDALEAGVSQLLDRTRLGLHDVDLSMELTPMRR